MRIFISHATEDKPVAHKLFKLPNCVDVWFDNGKLVGGQELDQSIRNAIEDSHLFIILISHSSTSSTWVLKELDWAKRQQGIRKTKEDFILPVIIDPDINLHDAIPELEELSNTLYLEFTDFSDEGILDARQKIKETLFNWACKWMEKVEPSGNSAEAFINSLENHLLEYQRRLFKLKAVLSWSPDVIVKQKTIEHIILVKDEYNQKAIEVLEFITGAEDEIRWRYNRPAQKAFSRFSTFLRDDIFHGAAFALNDILELINEYQTSSKTDLSIFIESEEQRSAQIETLSVALDDLVERTTDIIDVLKP